MKIIITAGGTSENIDTVRKITNMSSGKLGKTIAEEFINRNEKIEKIYYICTKHSEKPTHEKIEIIMVTDTNSLYFKVKEILAQEKIDYFIHSMAVSDYTVDYVCSAKMLASEIVNNCTDLSIESIENTIINNKAISPTNSKLPSTESDLIIKLKPTIKVITELKKLDPNIFLVGFKLLTNVSEAELENAALKLLSKNQCDLVVANDFAKIRDEIHPAFIISGAGNKIYALTKKEIAEKLTKVLFENV